MIIILAKAIYIAVDEEVIALSWLGMKATWFLGLADSPLLKFSLILHIIQKSKIGISAPSHSPYLQSTPKLINYLVNRSVPTDRSYLEVSSRMKQILIIRNRLNKLPKPLQMPDSRQVTIKKKISLSHIFLGRICQVTYRTAKNPVSRAGSWNQWTCFVELEKWRASYCGKTLVGWVEYCTYIQSASASFCANEQRFPTWRD